jgi:hypothetical protein
MDRMNACGVTPLSHAHIAALYEPSKICRQAGEFATDNQAVQKPELDLTT